MSDTASPAPVPAALLRGTLPPVAAATAAGLIGWILGSSTTVAGLAAAGVFAALAWGMGRSRAAVDPAVPTAPTGEPTAVSDAVDPSVADEPTDECGILVCAATTENDLYKRHFYVVEDATRAIDLNGSLAAAWKQMAAKGVKRIQSGDVEGA